MFWHVTKNVFLWIVISGGGGGGLGWMWLHGIMILTMMFWKCYIKLLKEWRNLLFMIYLWNCEHYTHTHTNTHTRTHTHTRICMMTMLKNSCKGGTCRTQRYCSCASFSPSLFLLHALMFALSFSTHTHIYTNGFSSLWGAVELSVMDLSGVVIESVCSGPEESERKRDRQSKEFTVFFKVADFII